MVPDGAGGRAGGVLDGAVYEDAGMVETAGVELFAGCEEGDWK